MTKTPLNEILGRLRAANEDPMSTVYAEVSKITLAGAIEHLETLQVPVCVPGDYRHWRVGEFRNTDDPTKLELGLADTDAQIKSHAACSNFVRWVGQSIHTYLWEEWMRKTDWVQDDFNKNKLALSGLGMHRADVMKREIDRLREVEKNYNAMMQMGEGRLDNALATFLATHTCLSQDGIDSKAARLSLMLNYAANDPVPDSEFVDWREQGIVPTDARPYDPEADGTDFAHPAYWAGQDDAVKVLCDRVNHILDGEPLTGVGSGEWEKVRQRLAALAGSKTAPSFGISIPGHLSLENGHLQLPMTDALRTILGRPNFLCRDVAVVLRLNGEEIRTKAEDEQAATIRFFLNTYLRHGPEQWAGHANADLSRLAGLAKAKIQDKKDALAKIREDYLGDKND